jgi:hypothetical protein
LAREIESLFESLRAFRSGWISRGWSWDRRFECVASTFGNADAAEARRLVSAVLTDEWTAQTLGSASPLLAELAEATGGVRSDQLLFATPNARVMAYGLWWPWGGEGTNISMRVGLVGHFSEDDMATLREIFGALDM